MDAKNDFIEENFFKNRRFTTTYRGVCVNIMGYIRTLVNHFSVLYDMAESLDFGTDFESEIHTDKEVYCWLGFDPNNTKIQNFIIDFLKTCRFFSYGHEIGNFERTVERSGTELQDSVSFTIGIPEENKKIKCKFGLYVAGFYESVEG